MRFIDFLCFGPFFLFAFSVHGTGQRKWCQNNFLVILYSVEKQKVLKIERKISGNSLLFTKSYPSDEFVLSKPLHSVHNL